jgi:hypothetical protein
LDCASYSKARHPIRRSLLASCHPIDGLITRRFCWSITAPTETDKTAVALLLSPCLAPGQSIGEYQVERGLNSIRHVGASVLGLIQATMPSKGPR